MSELAATIVIIHLLCIELTLCAILLKGKQ